MEHLRSYTWWKLLWQMVWRQPIPPPPPPPPNLQSSPSGNVMWGKNTLCLLWNPPLPSASYFFMLTFWVCTLQSTYIAVWQEWQSSKIYPQEYRWSPNQNFRNLATDSLQVQEFQFCMKQMAYEFSNLMLSSMRPASKILAKRTKWNSKQRRKSVMKIPVHRQELYLPVT